MKWLPILALALLPLPAMAAAPLIYEGNLTTGDPAQPPDPWPGLRFSVVDAAGEAWWSTLVDPGGPLIEVGPDGRFVAYLEDSPENPWAIAGFDQGRWLRVDVCPGAWPADPEADCQWVQLEQTQRLGMVPMAETISEAERARIRAEVMEEVRADVWVQPDEPGGGVATLRVSQSGAEGTFASLHDALDSMANRLIPSNLRVEVRIEPARLPYEMLERLEIHRGDGDRLHIVGEVPAPGSFDQVVLSFPGSTGIYVPRGARLGRLDGVEIVGPGGDGNNYGLVVREQAMARVGPNVSIRDFGRDCVHVAGGNMEADGIVTESCSGSGYYVMAGGVLYARDSQSRDHGRHGYYSVYGSTIVATGSDAQGNGDNDFVASIQSSIVASNTCQGVGGECRYEAGSNCLVYAPGALDPQDIVHGDRDDIIVH